MEDIGEADYGGGAEAAEANPDIDSWDGLADARTGLDDEPSATEADVWSERSAAETSGDPIGDARSNVAMIYEMHRSASYAPSEEDEDKGPIRPRDPKDWRAVA